MKHASNKEMHLAQTATFEYLELRKGSSRRGSLPLTEGTVAHKHVTKFRFLGSFQKHLGKCYIVI